MRALLALLALAVIGLAPAPAEGHGEEHGGAHGGAGSAIAGPVTVEKYRVEVLSTPGPLAAGAEHRLVVRVSDAASGFPVGRGRVRVSAASAAETMDGTRLVPATEATWAGSYEVPFTPARTGAHRVRVVLESLGGRTFDPPVTLDLPVTVDRAPGAGTATWLLVAGLALVTGLTIHAVARAPGALPGAGPRNLLDVPWIGVALRSPLLATLTQALLLALTAVVVVVGVADVQEPGVNFATKLTWTIWWAGVIFTFVLLGRAWCAVCPFGALNEWASRLAGATRRLPRPFRNLWWAAGLFVALTWADEQLGVVRSPLVTAGLVVALGLGAVLVGAFYARRSFCRYLCPIGGVIGLYSMAAPVELRSGDGQVCRAHRTKECHQGAGGAPGCPMFEFPQVMDRNMNCTFCGACVRSCSSGNLVLRLRGFGKDLWASARGALDEAYLAALLVGLTTVVTAQMLTAWPGLVSAAAQWLPAVVRTNLKPVTYLGGVETGLLLGAGLVVAPALLLGAAWWSNRLARAGGVGVRRSFVAFAYAIVPVGLGMHLAHNVEHLLQEGPGIVPALKRALLEFTPFDLGHPHFPAAPLTTGETVTLLQYGIVALFFALSLLAVQRVAARLYPDPGTAARSSVPVALLALGATVVNLLLLAQPMGMRHVM